MVTEFLLFYRKSPFRIQFGNDSLVPVLA